MCNSHLVHSYPKNSKDTKHSNYLKSDVMKPWMSEVTDSISGSFATLYWVDMLPVFQGREFPEELFLQLVYPTASADIKIWTPYVQRGQQLNAVSLECVLYIYTRTKSSKQLSLQINCLLIEFAYNQVNSCKKCVRKQCKLK